MKKLIASIFVIVLALLPSIITEKSDTPPPMATKEPNDIQAVSNAYIEEPKEEEVTAFPLTQENIEIMAHVMNGEAGNVKNDEWVLYYGSVVLNRVKSTSFPNTIKEVVFQRNPLQYACTVDGNYDRQPPERMYRLAEQLLRYGSIIPENVVFQATFRQGKIWKKCGVTYFCYQ